MKKILLVAFMALSVSVFGQQAEVKQAFDDYKSSIIAGDIDGVLASTSQTSFEYYEMLIDYALHADSSKVAALSIIDRMSVLGTRMKIPMQDLQKMDGKGYVRYGIENQMSNAAAFQSIDVGEITMDGADKALGQVMYGVQALPAQMTFMKESGAWKFDASSMVKMSEGALLQQLASAGMSEQDFLMSSLAQANGGQVPNDIWLPLVR